MTLRQQKLGLWLLLAWTSLPSAPVLADSIWKRRDPRSAYLFMDNRARRVGDAITIAVKETTGATNNEQRKLKKDTTASEKLDFAGKTTGTGSKAATAAVSADQSSDRSFQGKAEYESSRNLLDSMTVFVTDVLPNGNLVIEGYRKRVISNETRILRVTGVVRANDVDISNVVESRFIANLTLIYEGGGVETRFTNQGWLGRTTNKLWPH